MFLYFQDGKKNRVKQFKDINLIKGIYKNKFQLSQHPVLGDWTIRVYISGRYDYSQEKTIKVYNYVLPKFSVYIKTDRHLFRTSTSLRALVYGKYTFDKFVEGNVTVKLIDSYTDKVIQEKQLYVKDRAQLEFHFESPDFLKNSLGLKLYASLTEKHTGLSQSDTAHINVHKEMYKIDVDTDSIEYRENRPFRLKASVTYWNEVPVVDTKTPVIMQHGSKEYSAYLNTKGETLFEFDHEMNSNHKFRYKDSTYTIPNIFVNKDAGQNKTDSYFKLNVKGDR